MAARPGRPGQTVTEVFTRFFKGKRVLVTGHTGFKGAWLAEWLARLGAEVTGFALPPSTVPSLFTLLDIGRRVNHVEGDVRDADRLAATVRSASPEIVFHLAAQPIVRRSYRDPKETFDTNIGGTVNVMEAIRLTPSVRVAVIVTTDKCYENRNWVWGYRETDRLGGRDPYSASKAAAELVVSAYRQSFLESSGVGVASARAGNVIGGGDWAEDRLIPDAVRAVTSGDAVSIRHPEAVRPWQHVLEPVSAYLALATRLAENPPRYSGAWNFGPKSDSKINVASLAAQFLARFGVGHCSDLPIDRSSQPYEAAHLWLSCEKAHSELNWQPVLDLDLAIQMTADWYRSVLLEKADATAMCHGQTSQFVKLAGEQQQWWAT